MKRNLFKRVMALMLVACLTIALAACSKGGSDSEGKGGDGEAVNPYGDKEFIYAASYLNLDTDSYLGSSQIKNNTLYFEQASYDEKNQSYRQVLCAADLSAGKIETKELGIELTGKYTDSVAEYLSNFCVLDNGDILAISQIWKEDDSSTEYFLYHIGKDGSGGTKTDITETLRLDDVEWSYPSTIFAGKNNEVIISDNQNAVWVLDAEGNLIKKHPLVTDDRWIEGMSMVDGALVYSMWGDDGPILKSMDIESGQVKDIGKMEGPGLDNIKGFIGGENGKLCIETYDGIIEYDMASGTTEEILNWLDSDIVGNDVNMAFKDGDGYMAIITEYVGNEKYTNEIAILRKTATADLPKKQIITVGVMYSNSNYQKAIARFNRKSDTYRIKVKNYQDEAQDQDYDKAVENFNNDLLSGNAPDVVETAQLNVDLLTSKGLLEDLGKYLDEDPDLSRDDYFEKVLEANTSKEGTLYCIPSTFYIRTLFGRKSVVGDKEGWTAAEAKAVLEANKGKTPVGYMDRSSALSMLLYTSYNDFIDWNEGKCNFDTDEFKDVLQIAALFPKELGDDYYENYDGIGDFRDGDTILSEESIGEITDYQLIKLKLDADDLVAVGYPCTKGNGARLVSNDGFAINAACKDKEAAWSFVRSMISPDFYESNSVWSLPSLKSAFDESAKEDMKREVYTDENGEEKEFAKITYGMDNYTFEVFAATQEEVDAIKELIENSTGTICYDTSIYAIIEEETAAFFEGSKSVDDAAAVIQSRIQMYVDESR